VSHLRSRMTTPKEGKPKKPQKSKEPTKPDVIKPIRLGGLSAGSDEQPDGIEALIPSTTGEPPIWQLPTSQMSPSSVPKRPITPRGGEIASPFNFSLVVAILIVVGALAGTILLQPNEVVRNESKLASLKRTNFYLSEQFLESIQALEKMVAERGVIKADPMPIHELDSTASIETFRNFAFQKHPVVLKKMGNIIFGGQPWDLGLIKRVCGAANVTPAVFSPTAKTWAKLVDAGNAQTTLAQFIEKEATNSQLYLHDWSIPQNCPELLNSFVVPKFFSGDKLLRVPEELPFALDWPSLFIGAKGTQSGLHVDAFGTSFWMYLLKGKKLWHFYPQKSATFLYEDRATNSFEVNSFGPDYQKYPLHKVVTPTEYTMQAGDLIFVPAGIPHQVANLEDTVAISMNFIDFTNKREADRELQIEAVLGERSISMLRSFLNQVKDETIVLKDYKYNDIQRIKLE